MTAFGGIDITGAHTSHLSGGCSGEDGRTCAPVVPNWAPNDKGRGDKLPFERAGRITRIKLPVSGPTTITVRVVRRTSPSNFRVRRSSRDVLWARDDGAKWVRRAVNGNGGDSLGNQGVSMVLTSSN